MELEAYWEQHQRLGPLQRWMGAIREVLPPRHSGPIVVFIDEIDAVRSLPFSTDEFFAGIREFYNRRSEDPELARLTFCLLGVAAPSDLIRDTRTTPFNIGQRIELGDFSAAEAAALAAGLGRDAQSGAALLVRVIYWTWGHPYLTQRLCQAIAEDRGIRNAAGVDRLCEELFLSPRARERDDNLLFVRERILRSEADLAGLLDLYAQVHHRKRVRDDETSPLVSILRLSGIARVLQEGYLEVRNRIYFQVFDRAWVEASMPDAELRRQRAACRRGMLRTAAVAALILAVVGALALYAFRSRQEAIEQQRIAEAQRARAEQQEQSNRRLLYVSNMNLAQQDWETANIGRMNELLNAHIPRPGQEDMRGFEWYYLWHLSHSDLLTLRLDDTPVAFSADLKTLATLSMGYRTVKLWDAATGQELRTFKGHADWINSVVFSRDGKRLATGGMDRTARLWDATTGQELRMLKGHTARVWSAAFSPDGKRLATGSDDHTAKLWDVTTGQELLSLRGRQGVGWSVAFSPDGKRLAIGSGDRTAKLWDAATEKEVLARSKQ